MPRPARTSLGYISTPLIWQGRKRPVRGGPTPSRAAAPSGPTVFITKPSAPPTKYLSQTDRLFLSDRAETYTYPLVAKLPKVSPPSSAPPIRPPAELDGQNWTHSPVTPGVKPAGELAPEDGEEPGAGPRAVPGPEGQRQEKMLRPASSSDSSSAISSSFLYPSTGPPTGPETGLETGLGPGPALLLTLNGLLKNLSPSVSLSNQDRDLLVTVLAEESRSQTQIPHSSNPLKLSSQVRPTLPGPSPLSLHTDVSPSCPPGPLWPFCASGHLTPPPTIQTGRRQKVAFFSSSSATSISEAPSQRPLTSLLTEKEILSVVKIPSLPFHIPSPPVSRTPSRPSPPSLSPLPSAFPPPRPAFSSSSLPSSSPFFAPPLPPPSSTHPASVSPPPHVLFSLLFPLLHTPPSPTPHLSHFLPLSPPSSWPPSPLPTTAVPTADRNQEYLSLATDQTEPRVEPFAGPHPGAFDSIVSPPLPSPYLQTPPTSIIHSASNGQTVEEAWLQSEDVGISTSLTVPLTTTFSLSPAPKSGPSKGSVSALFSLGGHTHPADTSPSPLVQPRPLHCLLSTWLCGRSSANRTSLLQTAATEQRANQSVSGTAGGWRQWHATNLSISS